MRKIDTWVLSFKGFCERFLPRIRKKLFLWMGRHIPLSLLVVDPQNAWWEDSTHKPSLLPSLNSIENLPRLHGILLVLTPIDALIIDGEIHHLTLTPWQEDFLQSLIAHPKVFLWGVHFSFETQPLSPLSMDSQGVPHLVISPPQSKKNVHHTQDRYLCFHPHAQTWVWTQLTLPDALADSIPGSPSVSSPFSPEEGLKEFLKNHLERLSIFLRRYPTMGLERLCLPPRQDPLALSLPLFQGQRLHLSSFHHPFFVPWESCFQRSKTYRQWVQWGVAGMAGLSLVLLTYILPALFSLCSFTLFLWNNTGTSPEKERGLQWAPQGKGEGKEKGEEGEKDLSSFSLFLPILQEKSPDSSLSPVRALHHRFSDTFVVTSLRYQRALPEEICWTISFVVPPQSSPTHRSQEIEAWCLSFAPQSQITPQSSDGYTGLGYLWTLKESSRPQALSFSSETSP